MWENPVSDEPNPLMISRGERYVLPREWSLVLRDGSYLRPASPPDLAPSADPASGSLLWAPVAGVRYILGELRREPLPWHETRGVPRRALTDRASRLRVPIDDLVVWLELASVAGLVGGSQAGAGPTELASTWLASGPRTMWLDLIDGVASQQQGSAGLSSRGLGLLDHHRPASFRQPPQARDVGMAQWRQGRHRDCGIGRRLGAATYA